MVSSIKPEDQFTRWRSEYEADILVALASLAGERMFFDSDSSSGVSGDLDSATTVASYMEGYWGMGKTVSSSQAARRLEGATPGGGRSGAAAVGAAGDRGSMPGVQKLADRIEDNLSALVVRAEEILRENERYVLAVAHALETHKTLSGEDVAAVFDGQRGPLVDGAPYADDEFIARLREYHSAAARAHREHNQPDLPMPKPTSVYAIADGYGTHSNGSNGSGDFLDGAFGGDDGAADGDDVIEFDGLGSGNGSHGGPYGAPTYDPPTYGPQDGSPEEQN
jgi:cell division protease FtsH